MTCRLDEALERTLIAAVALLLCCVSASADDHRKLGPDFFECGTLTGTCTPDECAGPINITVLPDGGVKWNGAKITQKALSSYLDDARHVGPEPVFWIHVEDGTSYAAAASVISTFQKKRIKRMFCVVPAHP